MKNQRFSMDRDWSFQKGEASVLPKSRAHDVVYCFSKAGGAMGVCASDFDDSAWQRVDLPHDMQHLEPMTPEASPNHGYRMGGSCCYRKRFQLPKSAMGGSVRLTFDGVQGVSDVYFNGSKLYHSESGYSSFSLDLSDIASFGQTPNLLVVLVDGRGWEGWWYEGIGIDRHVWLELLPKTHVAENGVWVKPVQKGRHWQAECEVMVENLAPQAARFSMEAEVLSSDGKTIAKHNQRGAAEPYLQSTVAFSLPIDEARLWSPDSPALYTLVTRVVSGEDVDEKRTRFGLRTLRFDADEGFFLNGQPMKLYGTCNHHDHAGIGAAVPDDVRRYRLLRLKEMGCNAIRCSHNNPAPEVLELCDELGLMVMDENRWFGTSETHLGMLRGMVLRDRNHPSVILWSAFNEEPWQGNDKGRRLAQRQMAEIKRLDTTRPVLGAFSGGLMDDDGAADIYDILGVNYAVGIYEELHRKYPHKPIVSSETVSAFATRDQTEYDDARQMFDNYDTHAADWGETVREAAKAILPRPWVCGLFVWTGFDYRGEPTPYVWPSVSSHFGVMDVCGYPKDTFWLYRAYFLKEPVLHLLPHWNQQPGQTVRVMAYTNCDEVELLLNGASQGRKAVDLYTQPSWDVMWTEGAIKAIGYREGQEVIRDRRETTGPARALKLDASLPALRRDTRGSLVVDITAIDGDGLHVPTENSEVEVAVLGGQLMGMGNGDPNDHVPDQAPMHPLFHGRLQAVVRAERSASRVTVTARSGALGTVAVTLPVIAAPDELPEVESVRGAVLSGWRMSPTPTAEKPDPRAEIDDSNMNTLVPVSFDGQVQPIFDGHVGKYCLYRVKAELGAPREGRALVLGRVRGQIEVYVNGDMIHQQDCAVEGKVTAPVPQSVSGTAVIALILQNISSDGRAGVVEAVEVIG